MELPPGRETTLPGGSLPLNLSAFEFLRLLSERQPTPVPRGWYDYPLKPTRFALEGNHLSWDILHWT
jgi:hypothetical protein